MRKRHGFTLIELLVVVAIIAVLMAVLLPALQSARHLATRTVCAGNFRQIGIFLQMYFGDHGERVPEMVEGQDWQGIYEWNTGRWKGLGALKPYVDPVDPWALAILPSIDPSRVMCDTSVRGVFYDPGCPLRYFNCGNWLNFMYTLPWGYTGEDMKLAPEDMSTVTVALCYVECHPWTWQAFKTPAHGGRGFNALRPDGHVFWLNIERVRPATASTPSPYGKVRCCNGDY